MSIEHTPPTPAEGQQPQTPTAPSAPADPRDEQRALISEAAEANRAALAAEVEPDVEAPEGDAPLDAPDGQPEGEAQEQAGRIKPSILREANRKNAAAKRAAAEAKAALADAQRIKAEIERERAELRELEQGFKRDPITTLMQRTGMTREQVIAANLDGQASDVPPAVLQQLEDYRRELTELKQSLAERDKKAQEEAQQTTHAQRVQQDIDKIDGIITAAVDEYPASASVPRPFRDAVAKQFIAKAVAEMTELGDFSLYTHLDIIEAVEKRCEEHLGNIHESPYVKRRLSSVATSTPATQPRAAKGRQGLSARDAAAPAQPRGPLSADEIRSEQEKLIRELTQA